VLIGFFNFAVQREYATDNPAERTAKAPTKSEVPGIVTVAEITRLLEAASQDMLPYLAIGAFAGLRYSTKAKSALLHISLQCSGCEAFFGHCLSQTYSARQS